MIFCLSVFTSITVISHQHNFEQTRMVYILMFVYMHMHMYIEVWMGSVNKLACGCYVIVCVWVSMRVCVCMYVFALFVPLLNNNWLFICYLAFYFLCTLVFLFSASYIFSHFSFCFWCCWWCYCNSVLYLYNIYKSFISAKENKT